MREPESRADRKERTRRAILDAALALASGSTLAALSLRQVAKEVGIVPTAFYRHFDSVEELGQALVEESFVSLRAMLRDVRRQEAVATGGLMGIADASVDIIADHVRRHREHFRFIARERFAGPGPVREAIRHEIELCQVELATDLAGILSTWPSTDRHVLAGLIVATMVATAEEMVIARPDQERELADTARTRLRMLVVSAAYWRPEPA